MYERRIIRSTLAFIGIALLVTVASFGAQKGKPVPPTPLNVDIAPGNSITGDGAPYVDGTSNVRAEIMSGMFYFDTNEVEGNDGLRRVNLQFPALSGCGGANQPPCPAGGRQDVYVATATGFNGVVENLSKMNQGNTLDLHFAISWLETHNNISYKYALRWNQPSDNPRLVHFECLAGSPCTQWSASPNADALAGLEVTPQTKKATTTLITTVQMPFFMILTKQQ